MGEARPRHDPMAALRVRDFRFFSSARFFSATAMTLLQAALAWEVYDISHSPLQLGVLGLVRFLPSLGLSLVGGAVADAMDRRRIVLLSQSVPLACSVALAAAAWNHLESLWLIYGLVLLVACAASFENPSRQALLPSLVPVTVFPNAVTVYATFQQLGFVTGPAVAGATIALLDVGSAYVVNAVAIALAMVLMLFLRPRPHEGPPREVSISAIREGLSFVRHRPVILGAMTLDMFAVIFGGATALLPVYADILGVGAFGYGLLYAAFDIGAFAMALVLLARPPIDRTGRTLLVSVAVFGLMTILFGLSRSFAVSLLAYMAIGMADQVSVVMRQTTIQLATPDGLRGRVSSVNLLFIGASNQVGAMESGFVAAATSATFAVVSGGVGCLAVVAWVWAKIPELRSYRISEAEVEGQRSGGEVAPPSEGVEGGKVPVAE